MIQEILPGLFQIRIPLPESPLQTLNAYLIKDGDRDLLIDTGFNRDECLRALREDMGRLRSLCSRTDVFLTHNHADHMGLAGKLAAEGSAIYFHRPEAVSTFDWMGMLSYGAENGFPGDRLDSVLRGHPGFLYQPERIPEVRILSGGDTLDRGGYHFVCIHTPGHTRGHLCLYDPGKQLLLSGDHLLADITPNISCFSDEGNPLEDYLASLDMIRPLAVSLVCPGHRRLLDDHRKRIDDLKTHHERRSEEILRALNREPLNAFDVASRITWDLLSEGWDRFPLLQQWFATGEVIAHLRYLKNRGSVGCERRKGVFSYSVRSGSVHP